MAGVSDDTRLVHPAKTVERGLRMRAIILVAFVISSALSQGAYLSKENVTKREVSNFAHEFLVRGYVPKFGTA